MVLADGCITAPPHTGPFGRSEHSYQDAAEVEHSPPLFTFNGPVLIDAS